MIEQSILYSIFKNAEIYPQKIALISGFEPHTNSLSYSVLVDKIINYAEYLSTKANYKKKAIVISASQSIEFVCSYFAIHLVGAIAVPINPQLPDAKLQLMIDQCSAKLVILNRTAKLSNNAEIINFDSLSNYEGSGMLGSLQFPMQKDFADILFTTGTTGFPKGVMLTHHNIFSGASNINNFICNTTQDIELSPMPLSHSFALARLRCNLMIGATIVLANGLLLPGKIYKQLEETKATGFSSVPAGIAILFKFGEEKLAKFKNQLNYLEIGSSPMPLIHKEKLMELLPHTRICMHYGLTEASRSSFIEFHSDKDFLDSIGKPTSGVKLEIRNNKKNKCSTGENGEIVLQGNSIAKKYVSQGNILNQDGWFYTGDLGFINSKGYIFLSGRKSDIINIGGQKVAPFEIESLINLLPSIQESACIGVADPNGLTGESIKLFLVHMKYDSSLDKISDHDVILYLRDKLESYKIPSLIVWADNIPKSQSGKILRHLLR